MLPQELYKRIPWFFGKRDILKIKLKAKIWNHILQLKQILYYPILLWNI